MASHALNNKLDIVHLLTGSDGSGNQYNADVDVEGRFSTRNYIWNTVSLDWEAATGSLAAGSAVTVANFPASYPGIATIQGYNGTNWQNIRIDSSTRSLQTIDYAHHEIHSGSSFHAFVYDDTAATGELVNIYIKTANTTKYCHVFAQWSAGGAAIFRIYEGPTITANSGTNGVTIINHNRTSTNPSGCFDNATVPVANKYGTGVTKTGDGVVLLIEYAGVGKAMGGSGRNESEYILAPNTVYLFEVIAIGNNIALSIGVDWYEHTDQVV